MRADRLRLNTDRDDLDDVTPLLKDAGLILSVAEAAAMCRVDRNTVRNWVHRGHLTPLGWDGRRMYFFGPDVARTEKKLAEHAGRLKRTAA